MFCSTFCFNFSSFVNRTKRLGLVLKVVVLLCLPVPLLLWPVVGVVGSLLGGIGYGFFAPLLATFEAVGEGVTNKFHHCFIVSVIFNLCIFLWDKDRVWILCTYILCSSFVLQVLNSCFLNSMVYID